MINKEKVLYISYDGMTDPLGQSQVINYLIRLSKLGYKFDILSFEKKEKYSNLGKQIKSLLDQNNIGWYPQIFHTSPPIVSKIYDRAILYRVANKLQLKNKYDLIHCRSYTAAEIGLRFKNKFGTKFLFDMRGFWADEKADGGGWDRKKWFWNKVYNFYKKKEKEFIVNADHIISLTEAGKKEIENWSFYESRIPITVIPCCADSENFALTSAEKKSKARAINNIDKNTFVLSYLGSLGAWYMIDEMLTFFKLLTEKIPNSLFFIVTNSSHDLILEKLGQHKLQESQVKIITVPFNEVAKNMYASDCSVSFIKPVYSKISSSPVKTGEILSMGIPLIANAIGDAEKLLTENEVGILVKDFFTDTLTIAINKIDKLVQLDSVKIRESSKKIFSLKEGVKRYANVYLQLL